MSLLLSLSAPNSEKCRFVPFSRFYHSAFALNTILTQDLLKSRFFFPLQRTLTLSPQTIYFLLP